MSDVSSTPTEELRALRDLAADAAQAAGELIVTMRSSGLISSETKSSAVDLVTNADRAAETLIIEHLLAARPDDSVLGEEGGASVHGGSGLTWVIDPIDGTTNFVYGHSATCVSIAATVLVDDLSPQARAKSATWRGDSHSPLRQTVAAAVFNPFTDELFTAFVGGGSTVNGQTLHLDTTTELATALVATGFGYSAERRREQAAALARLLPHIRDIRRLGSAAYDLCLLSSGRVDAYYERGIQEWDVAAGILIAAEAGAAILGSADGTPAGTNLLVAAHPALAAAIQQYVSPEL
jgi:myo-inositol-1(or 4)-monophosphatase